MSIPFTKPWRLERAARSLLRDVSPVLAQDDVTNAEGLLAAGECELALELICDQLYEHGATITQRQFAALSQLSREMRVPPNKVECVAELVR